MTQTVAPGHRTPPPPSSSIPTQCSAPTRAAPADCVQPNHPKLGDPPGACSPSVSPSPSSSPSSFRPMEPDAVPDAAPEYTWAAPRRRTSMEEDQLYRDLITVKAKARDEATRVKTASVVGADASAEPKVVAPRKRSSIGQKDERGGKGGLEEDAQEEDVLPPYSCDIHVETVFQRKMEIEGATKRADDRSWSAVYVVLHGTSLKVYRCKSGWSLNRSKMGPDVSQDKPPWSKAGPLEKSYSLAYADVGIAADYVKRKHVIRIRAESEQFLISCVELETFVTWLDALFAAISIAAPIDDRDFPRDQSIPRVQRSRANRGQQPPAPGTTTTTTMQVGGTNVRITTHHGGDAGGGGRQQQQQQQQPPARQRPAPTPTPAPAAPAEARTNSRRNVAASMAVNFTAELREEQSATRRRGASTSTSTPATQAPNRRAAKGAEANQDDGEASGKWRPKHKWTATHDMVYAKLCYANLLFKSPRKSNFIVAEGIQWLVDWTSGKMIRVHPPKYSEAELYGPWQVVAVGNNRL